MTGSHLRPVPDAAKPDPETTPPIVRLIGVTKKYGAQAAVNNVSLDIRAGEFFTLLGPSGSGKTTTLRLISGFERLDSGRIEIEGQDVAKTPPFMRSVNTVFQDYALFPHMSVLDNVAYGPLMHKASKADAYARAEQALEMVHLSTASSRLPGQLSGGQRQRVAMARAVVNRPKVLLLDEPLGALDLKLRHEMQFELQRIQREIGITFIYVTHDQEEALTMSNRIAVFNQGAIKQIGAPRDLYERPADTFVAGFVGVSNTLTRDGKKYMLRPEKIAISSTEPATPGAHKESGVVRERHYLGMTTRFLVALDSGETLIVTTLNDADFDAEPDRSDRVWVLWKPRDAIALTDA